MNRSLVGIYHRLPSAARSGIASLRGLYLRWWRYGARTEELVAEAIERESWTAERWRRYQEERLAFVLERAAARVPHYRDSWAERRRRGDRSAVDVLTNWPVLDKETLRQAPESFVADDRRIGSLFHEHTSGTTGTPLDLWWSRSTVQEWYALMETRWRRWNGVSRRDRWALVGGQLVTPVEQRDPPFWVWNAALSQLYMSSYHLAPESLGAYLDALQRARIDYLVGYSSSLYALAVGALAARRRLPMKVAVTNAEPLFDYQREAIGAAFDCPVRETYGMAEIVAGASECRSGRLHLWPEVGWVELGGGRAGEPSDLIATGLLNADMPLIRYRVGDRAALSPASGAACACGRTLPMLDAIEGRADDALYTADGRRIGRLDPVFKSRLPIVEAQVVQESLRRLVVRYVPAEGFDPAASAAIADRLRERLGDVAVVLEEVRSIPRDANGKFRAVVCGLSREERAALDADFRRRSGENGDTGTAKTSEMGG